MNNKLECILVQNCNMFAGFSVKYQRVGPFADTKNEAVSKMEEFVGVPVKWLKD
jgi:hypothetical protein